MRSGFSLYSQSLALQAPATQRSAVRLVGVVDVSSRTCFVAVGLLVASVPVVRVFAMGHEEMQVAGGETHRAERHDADDNYCFMSMPRWSENRVWSSVAISEFPNLPRSKCSRGCGEADTMSFAGVGRSPDDGSRGRAKDLPTG